MGAILSLDTIYACILLYIWVKCQSLLRPTGTFGVSYAGESCWLCVVTPLGQSERAKSCSNAAVAFLHSCIEKVGYDKNIDFVEREWL